MMAIIRRWLLPLAALALATAPIGALSEPGADELAQNRQLWEQWKGDAAHLEQLRRDWKALRALSPERQARLRQLDRELHADEGARQARLRHVLD